MSNTRGYFNVEARWEQTHEAPGEAQFFEVDQVGGSLDDAKSSAQAYFNKHVASNHSGLQWVEGIYKKTKCYYAHTSFITLRISC